MRVFKKFFYVCLVTLSFTCLFACTPKGKVSVNSIQFTDSSVELLVNDTYAPQVRFVPRNSTVRDYVLTTNNGAVIKIEDDLSITAISAGRAVLTARSLDGDKVANMNIVVYDEPYQLDTPTQLRLDGDEIKFNGVTNAHSYCLKVNDKEIKLQNITTYKLTDFDSVLTVRVKAVGEGRVSLSSDYSDPIRFVKISPVKNVSVNNTTLTFDQIARVNSYEVVLTNLNTNSVQTITVNANTVDLSSYISDTRYSIKVRALSEGYDVTDMDITLDEVYDGEYSDEVTFRKLEAVTDLSLFNNTLSWNSKEVDCVYEVHFEGASAKTVTTTECSLDLTAIGLTAGDYQAYVYVKPTSANFITSAMSSVVGFKKLANIGASDIVMSDNVISWHKVDGATGYKLILNGSVYDLTSPQVTGDMVTAALAGSAFTPSVYTVSVVAYGDTTNTVFSDEIEMTARPTVEKLKPVSNFTLVSIDDSAERVHLSWIDENTSNTGYYIYVNGELGFTLNKSDLTNVENTYTASIDYTRFVEAGIYELRIKTFGTADNVFDSDYAIDVLNVKKLAKVTDAHIDGHAVTFVTSETYKKYDISLYSGDTLVKYETATSETSTAEFLKGLASGTYTVEIVALGDGEYYIKSDATVIVAVTKKNAPTLSISDSTLSWTPVVDMEHYTLQIGHAGAYTTIDTSALRYDIPAEYESGLYTFAVQGVGANNILSTEYSNIITVCKLDVIDMDTVKFEYDYSTTSYSLTFDDDDATGVDFYRLYIDGEEFDTSTDREFAVPASQFATAGVHTIQIQRVAFDSLVGDKYYINSDKSEPFNVTKLNVPTSVTLSESQLVVDDGIEKFKLYVKKPNSSDYQTAEVTGNAFALFGADTYTGVGLFDTVGEYVVKVQQLSTEPHSIDSEISGEYTFTKLDSASEIYQSNNYLYFAQIPNAINYDMVVDGVRRTCDYTIENGKVKLQVPADLVGGEKSLQIISVGGNGRYINSEPCDTINIKVLDAPTLSIADSVLTISEVTGASGYVLTLTTANDTYTHNLSASEREYDFDLDSDVTGAITITARAVGGSGWCFDGMDSEPLVAHRLAEVTLAVVDQLLVWDTVANANEYLLTFEDMNTMKFTTQRSYDFYAKSAGTHTVNMRAVTTINDEHIYINSRLSSITVTKLATPSMFKVVEGKVKYIQVADANKYILTIGDNEYSLNSDGEVGTNVNVSVHTDFANADFDCKLYASYDSDEYNYIRSDILTMIVNMVSTPTGIYTKDNQLYWDVCENASGYKIKIVKEATDDEEEKEYEYTVQGVENNSASILDILTDGGMTTAGDYTVTVCALGDSTKYLNSETSKEYVIHRLSTPTKLGVVNGAFSFEYDALATKYEIYSYTYNKSTYELEEYKTETILGSDSEPRYVLDAKEGLYALKVKAIGNGFNILDSEVSDVHDVIILPPVSESYVREGKLYVKALTIFTKLEVTFANGKQTYTKYFNSSSDETEIPLNVGLMILSTDYRELDYTSIFGQMMKEVDLGTSVINVPPDAYVLSVRLIGNTNHSGVNIAKMSASFMNSQLYTSKSLPKNDTYIKLPTPVITSADANGIVKWGLGSGQVYPGTPLYVVSIYTGEDTHTFETNSTEIDFSQDYYEYSDGETTQRIYFTVGSFYVAVYMKGDDTVYLNSESVSSSEVRIFTSPDVTQDKGILTWDSIPDVTTYKVTIKTKAQYDAGEVGVTETVHENKFILGDAYPAGEYYINVQACSDRNGMIASKGTTYVQKFKIDVTDANIAIVNGYLQFNLKMGDFTINDLQIVIDDDISYSLTIYDDIQQILDPNITVNGDVVTYDLPDTLSEGAHSISVTIYGNDENKLMSDSITISTTKLADITNIRVEDGKLVWDALNDSNVKQYLLTVTFSDAYGTTITYDVKIDRSTAPSYTLPDIITIGNVHKYDLLGDRTYTFGVRAQGNANAINNNAVIYETHRLQDIDTIISENGVVTWTNVANAVGYTLHYQQGTTNRTITLPADQNTYTFRDTDDDKFGVGDFSIYIIAHGNTSDSPESSYLTSRQSATVTFTKLPTCDTLAVKEYKEDTSLADTVIIWDAIEGATSYEIEVTSLSDGSTNEYTSDTNAFSLPDGTTGKYGVRVRALTNIDGKVNGEYGTKLLVIKPSRPTNFRFNDTLKRFEWDRVHLGDTVYCDQYSISYKYRAKSTDAYTTVTVTIDTSSANDAWWKPTLIGTYSDISIQAINAGFKSDKTPYGKTYTFDLFQSGDGTSTNPYVVANATHFANIQYYASAYYTQSVNIDFTGQTITLGDANNAFSGVYNGNNKELKNITTNEAGIFGYIKGATLTNLHIIDADLSVNISGTADLYVGLLASHIDNATISSSRFENITVTCEYTSSVSPTVYVGGLAGEMVGSTVSACTLDGSVAVTYTKVSYLAGVSAVMSNSTIADSTVDVKLTMNCQRGNNNGPFIAGIVAWTKSGTIVTKCQVNITVAGTIDNSRSTYVGGAVALNDSATVSLVTVTADITIGKEVGGVVAKNAKNNVVEQCISSGNISISANTATSYYIAGMIAENLGTLRYSYSTMNVTVTGTSSATIYASLLVSNNSTGVISHCFTYTDDTDGVLTVTNNKGKNYQYALVAWTTTGSKIEKCYYTSGTTAYSGNVTNATAVDMADYYTEDFVSDINDGEDIFAYVAGSLPKYKGDN